MHTLCHTSTAGFFKGATDEVSKNLLIDAATSLLEQRGIDMEWWREAKKWGYFDKTGRKRARIEAANAKAKGKGKA